MEWDETRRHKMITLFNKIFSRFNLQVVSKEEPTKEERSFLEDITSPEFIQKHPDFLDRYVEGQKNKSLYVGDINYLEDKNGTTYYQDLRSKTYYCDYDVKNPSKEILGLMIDETTFTPQELEEKLKK
jgi:hypothetical protein